MLLSILEQLLIALPLVLGGYLTLSLLKLPAFSLESAYLCGAVAAFLAKGASPLLVLLSAAGGGALVGVMVFLFNQGGRIPFLLSAIIVNGLCHGMTQYLLGTSMASFQLTYGYDESYMFLIVNAAMALLLVVLFSSSLGYSWAIYGQHSHFFTHHRMSERYVLGSALILGHGAAGVSGFFFAQANGFIDLTMSFGVLLLCITALMVGKLSFQRRYPTLLMPVAGLFIYLVIQQSLLRCGLNLKYFNAFQALVVFAILVLGQRHGKKATVLDHLGV